MPHMYILECADGSYYTGSTWHLEKRLWEHQNGLGANHTKKHLPVKLVYCEYYDRVEDAFHREKQIQGWSRRKKEALMQANKEKLIEYSRNYTQYGNPASASASASASTSSAYAYATRSPLAELVEASAEPAEPVEGAGVLLSMPPMPSMPSMPSLPSLPSLPELVEGNEGDASGELGGDGL